MSPRTALAAHRATIEAVLLIACGVVMLASAVMTGPTNDERIHLSAGVTYWQTGRRATNYPHPPLSAIYALPLYAAECPPPPRHDLLPPTFRRFGRTTGRWINIALFLAFAWAFGRTVGRQFGPGPGLAALVLMLTGPTAAAHAYLVTTDSLLMMLAFAWFALCVAWVRRPSAWLAVAVGASGGAMLLAKHSALLLVAATVVGALGLAVWRWISTKPDRRTLARITARTLAHGLLAATTACVVIGAAYGFRDVGQPFGSLWFLRSPTNVLTILEGPLASIPSPLPAGYLAALDDALQGGGRPGYFAGEIRDPAAFPAYFITALLMKPPLVLHGLLALALAAVILRRHIRADVLAVVAIPLAVVLAYVSLTPGYRIGVRHVLFVMPFLFAAAAWGTFAFRSRWIRGLAGAAVVLFAVTGLGTAPHQLAYFNQLAGGPSGAWRWFNDSNQDWDQGVAALRRYARSSDQPVARFPVPPTHRGLVAIKTNDLTGCNPKQRAAAAWLRAGHERVAFVHPYWHIYDLGRE